MNTPPIAPTVAGSSTRPYLIRALHDWCTDNGFTPFIAVFVDSQVQVPLEYVKDSEIVLNLGFEATTSLKIGNEAIEFKARFGGISREIVVPVDRVIAIYARENGQGMAFPSPPNARAASAASVTQGPSGTLIRGPHLALSDPDPNRDSASPTGSTPTSPGGAEPPNGPRPSLKRVK